jgi:hypothetical protein
MLNSLYRDNQENILASVFLRQVDTFGLLSINFEISYTSASV